MGITGETNGCDGVRVSVCGMGIYTLYGRHGGRYVMIVINWLCDALPPINLWNLPTQLRDKVLQNATEVDKVRERRMERKAAQMQLARTQKHRRDRVYTMRSH